MKILAVIPARLESKRLPGKVLRQVGGKPLIQHVYERVLRARKVDEVLIATDSPEVEEACRMFTSGIFLSRQSHASGTDRIAEVARTVEAGIIINVQCDEPMIDPPLIDALVDLFRDPAVQMASAASRIHGVQDLLDPNVVKVVTDQQGDALYFSRAPIPWSRNDPPSGAGPLAEGAFAHKHIGVYVYRRECLLALAEQPRTPLETLESLEQLRAQENGWKIRILEWDYHGIDVDTEEDLERLRVMLEREEGPVAGQSRRGARDAT
jgi:3-deoxy-manno-octulosonate cytidylyltransferase (CMP-KDO synthetase)